ncbi:MAG TPA: hypothetical protein VJI68_00100 [Candidatus Nanoarchaeia archaeon]|nr:hypothetical protein [Candidatus Nanoarchaeia archaeon]
MTNKKGDLAFGLYFWPTFSLLIITLIIFGIIFFIVGIKSDKITINSQVYEDSSKIITVSKSPTNVIINEKNLSISELISLAHKDESYKEKLNTEFTYLINKIPKPENKKSNWNAKIIIDNNEFLKIDQSSVGSSNYFNQVMIIPLEDKKIAKLELSLSCRLCKLQDLGEFV